MSYRLPHPEVLAARLNLKHDYVDPVAVARVIRVVIQGHATHETLRSKLRYARLDPEDTYRIVNLIDSANLDHDLDGCDPVTALGIVAAILDTTVEGWTYPDQWRNGFSYASMGDVYVTTVGYCSERDRFYVATLGDLVESGTIQSN